MSKLQMIDADGHLDELPDEIVDCLDPPLKGERIIGRTHGLFPLRAGRYFWAALTPRFHLGR